MGLYFCKWPNLGLGGFLVLLYFTAVAELGPGLPGPGPGHQRDSLMIFIIIFIIIIAVNDIHTVVNNILIAY